MIVIGLAIAAILGPIVVAAWIHHGYAWRGYQAAKAAVPPARETWLYRLAGLGKVLLLLALAVGILWAYGGRNQ